MDFVIIGEYADSKERQREFIRSQRVDLTAGAGASEPFSPQTSSIRVAGNVPHFWRMGEAESVADGQVQYRPAEAVEAHNVGGVWVMSFEVES